MRIEDAVWRYGSIQGATEAIRKQSAEKAVETGQESRQSFEDILKQKIEEKELIFSKHAQQRLAQRDIELSEADLQKLNAAVRKAEEKGVDNTLVLSEKGAFVVNVSNHIVITAMSGNDMKENVFTQIDGAVVI